MSVSLIVPFRPDGAERDRNWRFLHERYETLYPDWEILVEEGAEGEWRKGTAVNAGVAKASGDVLVIADADVAITDAAMQLAIEELETHPWVVPHFKVYRLTDGGTIKLVSGDLQVAENTIELLRRYTIRRHWAPPGGGMSIMRSEDFVGLDENFAGWGGEDISFARALDTLVGTHRRLEAIMLHLWHLPMKRRPRNRASVESEARANLYLEANGDPVAMRSLVEQEHEGVIGGGVVVGTKEVIRSVPLDERFVGWGLGPRRRKLGDRPGLPSRPTETDQLAPGSPLPPAPDAA